MDRKQVQQWREGWLAVAEAELAEERNATFADRWRRFQRIMQFARAMGWIRREEREPTPEDAAASQRWTLLRSRSGLNRGEPT